MTEQGTKWAPRSMQTVPSPLKVYLEFIGAGAEVLLSTSFSFPRESMPVRAMGNETVEALWEYVKGDGEDMRAKAIVTLLPATGIRPVDIANLTFENISWDSDSISFVQSKTGVCMSIELFPVIGDAIVRYVTEQRPKGDYCRAMIPAVSCLDTAVF
jgi:integrase